MELKNLLKVTVFGANIVLFVFKDDFMLPRIEFVVGEQPHDYDHYNIRLVDLISGGIHLRVSNNIEKSN